MTQPPKPRGLGRGLAALLGDDAVQASVAPDPAPATQAPVAALRGATTLPLSKLRPSRFQARTHFVDLDELAASIREHGLLQPILVRPLEAPDAQGNSHEIVAGERRWRAAQMAGLHEVPVVVRRLADRDSAQLGLVENLQRSDIGPIETARGLQRLVDEFGQTQEEVAQATGLSRAHVANILRLLGLPVPAMEALSRGDISEGVARALLAFPDPGAILPKAIAEHMTVRDLEALRRGTYGRGTPRKRATRSGVGGVADTGTTKQDPNTEFFRRSIEHALGLRVELQPFGKGDGMRLTIVTSTLDQLDAVAERLMRGRPMPATEPADR